MENKVLSILAWVAFIISVISYVVDDLPFEATYFAVVAIFLAIAPRKLAQ